MPTRMEVLSLFPRYLLKGVLPPDQLLALQAGADLLRAPGRVVRLLAADKWGQH